MFGFEGTMEAGEAAGAAMPGLGGYHVISVPYFKIKDFLLLLYSENGPVAQLVRASPCHGEGRRFESDLGRRGCNSSFMGS